MARTKKSLSLTDEIYDKLYNAIMNGEIPSGANLNISSLKEKFGVSLAVIREALLKLTAQGLVEQKPNCGFDVVELNSERLEHVIDARKINEGIALKLALKNGDIQWQSNIIAKAYELEHTPVYLDDEKKDINPEWNDRHKAFHYALIEGCGNEVLLSICNYLWNISQIYRKQSLLLKDENRNFQEEHKHLMDAVLKRDEKEALELFETHIENTKMQMLLSSSQHY